MYIHQVEAQGFAGLMVSGGQRHSGSWQPVCDRPRILFRPDPVGIRLFYGAHAKYPGTQPLIPDIPPACGIPNPVEHDYIYGGPGYDRAYIEYLMSARKEPGESYTYGERLTRVPLSGAKLTWWEEGNEEIVDKREVDGKAVFE